MGNKQKKSPSKLLFEYDLRSPFPSNPNPKNPQTTLTPKKTPPKRPLDVSPAEFKETLNFCLKNQKINDICEPQLILTQANALFLNNEAIKNNENPRIHNFLTHAQIIQIHAHLEYYNEFNTMAKSQVFYNNNINKSVAMSPIQIRNSNKAEEFNTPSPLKSEFKVNFKENVEIVENEENYENLQKKNEIYKEKNENFSRKIQKNEENNQRTTFLKPNFVHFSRQFNKKTSKNTENDQEEDLELSLKKINEKLRKNKYFLKENREISNNEVKYMKLDLWKTKEKPTYLDLSTKKSKKNLENGSETDSIYQIEYNIRENRVKNPKKPISNENNNKIQSFYSHENLKKYLNKSHSDFSNNSRFLAEKRPISPHIFAENRGNFLYMNYDYNKKQKQNSMRKITNIERENLENSLINLKKSLNLPQKTSKIMKRTEKKEENYPEEVDLKSVEVEKLRRSLVFSKKMRLGASKEN